LVLISVGEVPWIGISGPEEMHAILTLTMGLPSSTHFPPSFVFLPALLRLSPFCRRACRENSLCQAWIIWAQWRVGSAGSWLHCLSCFWLAKLLTVPLAHLLHAVEWNYTWPSSVARASQGSMLGGGNFQSAQLQHCLQGRMWCVFLFCLFFNSCAENGSSIPGSGFSLHFEDLGFGEFYKYIVNQL
jgi:hypothetical protein